MNYAHYLELIVRSSEGDLETSLKIPLDSTPAQREEMVKLWINAIQPALKIPATSK